jgi:hypothetical protein
MKLFIVLSVLVVIFCDESELVQDTGKPWKLLIVEALILGLLASNGDECLKVS